MNFEAGDPMSKMVVEKNYFSTRAEVMDDIRESGYWPTTYISNLR